MKIKIDENFPNSVQEYLTDRGHDCHSVHDEGIGGGADDQLIEICRAEKRHLFSLDVDFADIVTYPPENYCGIVVFRISRQDTPFLLGRLDEVMSFLVETPLEGRLVIINDSRIRTR